MQVIEHPTPSVLSRSGLPASSHAITPFIGCTHACLYCYAEFMKRFCGVDADWGTFVIVKNSNEANLGKKLSRKDSVLIGSVTDAYQLLEKKFCKMPNILRMLKDCEAHVEILTKSSLVLRDIELLKKMRDVTIGISIGFLDNDFRKAVESGASSIEARLDSLRQLHEAGIRTYLSIAPFFPGITDPRDIFSRSYQFVDYYLCENLNLRGSGKKAIFSIIERMYPKYIPLYNKIYVEKDLHYWDETKKQLLALGEEYNRKVELFFHHQATKALKPYTKC